MTNIVRELLDATLVRRIGLAAGLSEDDLATIRVSYVPTATSVTLYGPGASQKTLELLKHRIWWYIMERTEGHTTAYFLAALTNRLHPVVVKDRELSEVLKREPTVPPSLIKKLDYLYFTNAAGTFKDVQRTYDPVTDKVTERTNRFRKAVVERCARFLLLDGEVAWIYALTSTPGVESFGYNAFREDSKEFDPNYTDCIKKVDEEVKAELQRDGKPIGWDCFEKTDRGIGTFS